MANLSGVRSNEPFYRMGRVPREKKT